MVRAALGQREDDDGTTCAVGGEAARIARRQAVRITVWAVALALVAAAATVAIATVLPGSR